jgi:hypothetical protein
MTGQTENAMFSSLVMYSAKDLKKKYGSLSQARSALGMTARGWQALADKLNQPTPEAELRRLKQEVQQLQQEVASLKNLGDPVGFWLLDGNFDRSRFTDFAVPEAAFKQESIANKFYKQLSRKFHPDKGGTASQMANLNTLYGQILAFVELNNGMGA